MRKKFTFTSTGASVDEIIKINEQTTLPEHPCKNPILLLNNQGKNVGIVDYVDEKIKIYINTNQGKIYIENSDNSDEILYDNGSGIKMLAVNSQDFRMISSFVKKTRKIKAGYQGVELDFSIKPTNIRCDEIDVKNGKEQQNPLLKDAFAVFRNKGEVIGYAYGKRNFIHIDINDGCENISLSISANNGDIIYADNPNLNQSNSIWNDIFPILKTFM